MTRHCNFSKDVRLPVQLQRAMAAEAEAAREARAKVIFFFGRKERHFAKYIYPQVIAAEGEQKASRALREASSTIAESSAALQLRYLQVSHGVTVEWIINTLFQTLNSISAEKNSTIIFPIPLDIMSQFVR